MPFFSDFFREITTVGFCFCHHFVRTRRGGDEMGVGVARNVARCLFFAVLNPFLTMKFVDIGKKC